MRRVLALALLAAGCASAHTAPSSSTAVPSRRGAPVAARCRADRADRWADCVLAHLTLRQKAAQMVWPQLFGDYVAADAPGWTRLTGWVEHDQVGGLVMSIGSPLEVAAKLNALQRRSDLPLLVGADLEDGAGFRERGGYFLPNAIYLGGATLFPPQMAIGATGDTALAAADGRVTAIEGRALGIQLAFAPDLDVNTDPDNPIINTRSFGDDPAAVARMGTAFISALQSHGMMATGKHFLGHGDTDVNSHLALPVVRASRARLDSIDLVPFRAAIRAHVGAIMTFHGDIPALDSTGVPATLSPRIITGLLRGKMGFRGLTISDAMDMRGVLDRYGPVEAAKRAVGAGDDVLIMPVDVTQTIDAIVAGVSEGRYPEARIDSAVRHILIAKARLGLARGRTVSLRAARRVVGDTANARLAAEAAERSITLVRDSAHQLPLSRLNRGARVLSVTYAAGTDLGAGVTFDAELRSAFPATHSLFIDAVAPHGAFFDALQAADSADVVIVSSYLAWNNALGAIAAPRDFVEFVQTLVQRGEHPILVAMGDPYLLRQVPSVGAYLVGWGGFPVSQRAAARALLGSAPITGRLPITIPSVAPRGAGLGLPAASAARASLPSPAVKVFLLEESGRAEWCAYDSEAPYKAAVEKVGAMTVATLSYSRDKVSRIAVAETDESGDWMVYDHYALDGRGRIVRLVRRINVLPGDRSVLQTFSIRRGTAERIAKAESELSTGKPLTAPRSVWTPDLPIRTDTARFPFARLLERADLRTSGRSCARTS